MSALARRLASFAVLALSLPAIGQDAPEVGRAVTIDIAIVEFAGVEPTPATADPATPEQALARLRQFEKEGRPVTATRMRLATLDNQMAQIQHGEDAAVPTGRMAAFGGRLQTSYERRSTGTQVGVMPRIEDDGTIVMELTVERSRLLAAPAAEASDAEQAPPAPLDKMTSRSTLRVPDGQTVVAGAFEVTTPGGTTLGAILVTARASDRSGQSQQGSR